MGITERRLRQKDEVRSSILATAWQIVTTEGWQALSIRKIADAIEYSVPVIYDHFENKESILMEFARDGFNQLAKKMEQARHKHEDPADQIRAVADAYWNFAFRNKEYYQVMFNLGIPCCEEAGCLPEKTHFRELMLEPIAAILEKHNRTDIDPCLKGHTFWSVIHGLISIKMMRTSDMCEQLNKMVLDDAINGFIKNLSR
ncbi:MAG: TetR/AcrR family transcriptional regulator [Candidatus Pseudobacter hemicellulosilyticus]|uniref:TetR/AcrR family transcriptional regulator n=1 Tax=Candidatus Pseudobacter hemicellulosilyticus TaxID=3121375 RepID=A0AAJ6BFY9_9BACT|nr:MAG: TetR/AcrR family transcriptional regulator [Pseudobacter sp.]